MLNQIKIPSVIVVIVGAAIRETIGPFDSNKNAAKYLAEGNGPKDATQVLIVPLSPLGLYIHPKFPRLTPMEGTTA